MNFKLDNAYYATEPNQIIISPQYKTGWEIIISQSNQVIIKQYKLFGLRVLIKHRIPFSDVATIRAIRSDVSVYKGTSLKEKADHSMRLWHISDQESFVGEEQKGFRHEIAIITNQGTTINIASGTTSWDDLEAGITMSPKLANLLELVQKMVGKH